MCTHLLVFLYPEVDTTCCPCHVRLCLPLTYHPPAAARQVTVQQAPGSSYVSQLHLWLAGEKQKAMHDT